MPKMSADLGQGETLRKQVSSTRVAQGVRAGTRRLDAQANESCCDDAIESAMSEWPARCAHTEKNLPILGGWAHFTDVPGDGISQGGNEWADASAALLCRSNRQSLLLPVHVLQTKALDFADPQSIDRQQQQDWAVADVSLTICLCTR